MRIIPVEKSEFFRQIEIVSSRLGRRTCYLLLLLYYAYHRDETPRWAKKIIAGAIGYFLLPLDGVPDFTPVIGFSDDLVIVAGVLGYVSTYIDETVRQKAEDKVQSLFGDNSRADRNG